MRTQVAIIGAGPAGLLLGHLMYRAGIDAVILEQRSPDYVLGRIRAGVLEAGTRDLLNTIGLGSRMEAEGLVHDGIEIAFDDTRQRFDFHALIGRAVMVYGQTEVTSDLMVARAGFGGRTIYDAEDVTPRDFDGGKPTVTYRQNGITQRLDCDFIVGCDGYHGPSRQAVPASAISSFERTYPFGWLGVMVEQAPVAPELIYASHRNGFALCSMRSPTRSRYYLQCDADEDVLAWSDGRFWDELRRRIGVEAADNLQTGPSIEKSIAPLRSFVVEPLRFGRLFLAGDAAHIVPPTGAKGLNLAVSDVRILAAGLQEFYADGSTAGVYAYSAHALRRIWQAERFSWWMTSMLHRFPNMSPFERRLQRAEFDQLRDSRPAAQAMAAMYTG